MRWRHGWIIGFGVVCLMGCHLRLSPQKDPFYQAVLDQYPQHPGALFITGQALIRQGRFEDAEPYFRRLIHQHPERMRYWLGWAQCLLEQKDYAAAEKALNQAIQIESSAEAFCGLGSIHMITGRLEDAREWGRRCESEFGASFMTARLQGDLFFIENHYTQALAAYEKSLTLQPEQPALIKRTQDLRDFLTTQP